MQLCPCDPSAKALIASLLLWKVRAFHLSWMVRSQAVVTLCQAHLDRP